MKHRSNYRIIQIHKKGFYTYYKVQKRLLWFFWIDDSPGYDNIARAYRWIDTQSAVEKRSVVW